MRERAVLVLLAVGLFGGLALLPNLMEWMEVQTILGERVRRAESSRISDRETYEAYVRRGVEDLVGVDADVEVRTYHYQGNLHREDVDVRSLPNTRGIQVQGDYYRLSALVVQVRWFQKVLYFWERDVAATRTLLVDPGLMGSSYGPPPANHFDFVDEPWTLLESPF